MEPQGRARARQCSRFHRSQAAPRRPVWGLRYPCQYRMGQRRHGPRHGFIRRPRHSSVVEDDGKEAPRQSQTHKAKRIMITAEGGGSNGHRVRLWKVELQKLADELKIPITVCHFPPGTSKWNKIEHRLFSFITINWRGKPLRTYRAIVQLIAAANIFPHDFHGEWNYTIAPIQKRSKR